MEESKSTTESGGGGGLKSFINGIIDCVALPSTSDTPVQFIRKSPSASDCSPTCVSAEPADLPVTGSVNSAAESDSDSTAIPSPPDMNNDVRGVSSASSSMMSRWMMPGYTAAPMISSVLTAEGIIMDDDKSLIWGSCGDCTTPFHDAIGGDYVDSEDMLIDNAVVRQFEAAFATFLYKNPAFTTMSHTTIQKLRTRLLKESAENVKMEKELQKQLEDIRDAKRNSELELQRELLVVTMAKASREAELQIQIQKTRQSCMMLDQQLNEENGDTESHQEGSSLPAPETPNSIIGASDSFGEFQKELQKNKMEQAHILAEMEKIKMQIAEESVLGTTYLA